MTGYQGTIPKPRCRRDPKAIINALIAACQTRLPKHETDSNSDTECRSTDTNIQATAIRSLITSPLTKALVLGGIVSVCVGVEPVDRSTDTGEGVDYLSHRQHSSGHKTRHKKGEWERLDSHHGQSQSSLYDTRHMRCSHGGSISLVVSHAQFPFLFPLPMSTDVEGFGRGENGGLLRSRETASSQRGCLRRSWPRYASRPRGGRDGGCLALLWFAFKSAIRFSPALRSHEDPRSGIPLSRRTYKFP